MLDATDRLILTELLVDGRLTLKELASKVGLSSPSVSERLRRLEERQVIRGQTVDIDPRALGYTLLAIVRVRPLPGQLSTVERLLIGIPEVCECDKVTGEDCFIVRMYLRSMEQLDELLDSIGDHAETSTAIVKKQVVQRRAPPLHLERPT